MNSLPLGDITAESDHEMLQKAFYESPDYKTIIESSNRSIIVGRRGTGKSAINYKLIQYWKNAQNTYVFPLDAEETQIIGIRELIKIFGENFSYIKAGAKLLWRYAIYMEIATWIFNHYKYSKNFDTYGFFQDIIFWNKERGCFTLKARKKLKLIIDCNKSPETIISELGELLNLDNLENSICETINNYDFIINTLIDKTDEGYSPDTLGIALVDGFVQSVIDINNRFREKIRCFIFIRDNIYRAIAISDQDFTRNIESHILRLHWDEYNLFNLICNRMRVAFKTSTENNIKLWNRFTARDLQKTEGFKYCLRLTLYRPRDILVLLNNAFDNAKKQNRDTIIPEDIEFSSKSISRNRLNDLHKEYESIFPSIDLFTIKFGGGKANLNSEEILEIINSVLSRDDYQKDKQKDISLIGSSTEVLQRLHSIGFIGIKSKSKDIFIFCHDGRTHGQEMSDEDNYLIHPCYWLALNLSEKNIESLDADEIYDEYEIEVTSITEDQRNARIEKLVTALEKIPLGKEGAYEFENWCFDAIRILFAGSITNIEHHPNKNGLQQRDIIGTNQSDVHFWKRVFQDYKTRQVIFEIKNFVEINAENYRQLNSYLSKNYGKLAFIICRCNDNNLRADKEIKWLQEIYYNFEEKIIIKLSAHFIEKHLRKLRSPQKHDAINKALSQLLDTYLRRHIPIKAR